MSKPIHERKKWIDFHSYYCVDGADPACLICFPRGGKGDGEGTRIAAAAPPSASRSCRLTVEDLGALADEASRQSLSLACLVGAMEDGAEIVWMGSEGEEEKRNA